MVESRIESARKLYDPPRRSSSMSLIFLTPDVSLFESTFISRFCDSEKVIDIERPDEGTP
ncbi:unknown [Alistipes sp. CAG:268]|nr:unknown [Alistipes sp. CAG:268]